MEYPFPGMDTDSFIPEDIRNRSFRKVLIYQDRGVFCQLTDRALLTIHSAANPRSLAESFHSYPTESQCSVAFELLRVTFHRIVNHKTCSLPR